MSDGMERFAKLGAMLWRNGKARTLAKEHPHAFAVWTFALSYCAHLLNDGMLTDFDLKGILGASDDDIDALLDARMLERHDDGSLWVHDFVQAQGRSRADVEIASGSRREAARRAGIASAKAKAQRKLDNSTEFNERSTVSNDPPTEGQRTGNDSQRTPDATSTDSNTDTDTDTEGKKEKTSFFPKKTKISADFTPDGESVATARRLGLDADAEARKFVAHWAEAGGRRADWQRLFRGWLANNPKARQPGKPPMPEDAWIEHNMTARLPDGSDAWTARRRLMALIRDGTGWAEAADTAVAEAGLR